MSVEKPFWCKEWLFLAGNGITGKIPSQIGKLSDLVMLSLGYNQLTGSLPSELGLLTSLLEFAVDHNGLSGTIPEEIYHEEMNLNALILSHNSISGSISSKCALVFRPFGSDIASHKLSHLDNSQNCQTSFYQLSAVIIESNHGKRSDRIGSFVGSASS